MNTKPQPDFSRLHAAITRQRHPDRVPTAEVGVDIEIIETFMGRPVDLPTFVSFWVEAGYDYLLLQVRGQPLADSHQVKIADGQLALHPPEATASTFGSARSATGEPSNITDEQSFESYPWIGPQDVYYKDVDLVRDLLPDGMKVIVNCGPVFQFLFRAMGLETMSIAMFENPGLLQAIAARAGELIVSIAENVAQRDWVGGIWYGDDMAYTEGLMVSPAFLRQYLFPYVRQIGEICREYDKLFILHSDGDLSLAFPDIIDCGVQGVHPNEPTSVDMASVKDRWGDRLSLLGGIDLDLLACGTPDEVTTATKTLIERAGPGGGVAIGSGNSVANYVPIVNYKAMLEAIRTYGAIY
ncbi:MAG: uroporphyrinogen decarboxylase family protein [Lentisphaeria bacterium]|jgi:uroporphyrinogen decarboxylase|nr:uroporphyrinogen decarboxylase family protein [Lentisphaeria bacterium]